MDYARVHGDSVDHHKLWKILKEMGIPDHLPASWEICMQVKKQRLELDMEQQTGSKLEKQYIRALYCHCAYFTYMQSTSWEILANKALAGIKIPGSNINNLKLHRWHHPYGREQRTKELLDESERGDW